MSICLKIQSIFSLITSIVSLFVSLIQLYEYFAWKYIHNEKIIYYLSIFGPLIILLQLLLISYSNFNDKTELIITISLIFIVDVDTTISLCSGASSSEAFGK